MALIGLRAFLGLVLVLSGIGKILSADKALAFAARVISTTEGPASIIVWVTITLEICFGVLLILGGKGSSYAAIGSSFLLLIFTITALYEPQDSCGCFGNLLPPTIDIYPVFRNLGLFFVSMIIMRAAERDLPSTNKNKDK